MLDGGQRYILLPKLNSLKRRIGDPKFPAELQQSQIPSLLPNESSHVLVEIPCHSSKTERTPVPHMGFLGIILLASRMKACKINYYSQTLKKSLTRTASVVMGLIFMSGVASSAHAAVSSYTSLDGLFPLHQATESEMQQIRGMQNLSYEERNSRISQFTRNKVNKAGKILKDDYQKLLSIVPQDKRTSVEQEYGNRVHAALGEIERFNSESSGDFVPSPPMTLEDTVKDVRKALIAWKDRTTRTIDLVFEDSPSLTAQETKRLLTAADSGDDTAMVTLGKYYGSTGDYATAEKLCTKAAELNNSEGEFLLAVMYLQIGGTNANPESILRLLNSSAKKGNAGAQFILGAVLATGVDGKISKNLPEAVTWLDKAAKSNDKKWADRADKALSTTELATIRMKQGSDHMLDEMVKIAKDPDSGKYGGPSTKDVLRILNGGGTANASGSFNVLAGAMLQGMTLGMSSVEEIRRGKVLTSLLSNKIPTGTEVFPIRVIYSSKIGSPQQDMYFFKDEFGDWSAIPKE